LVAQEEKIYILIFTSCLSFPPLFLSVIKMHKATSVSPLILCHIGSAFPERVFPLSLELSQMDWKSCFLVIQCSRGQMLKWQQQCTI